jgi:hypothetical protein
LEKNVGADLCVRPDAKNKFIPLLNTEDADDEKIFYYERNFSLDKKISDLLEIFSEEFYFEERRFYVEFEFNSLVFRKFTKNLLELVNDGNFENNNIKLKF